MAESEGIPPLSYNPKNAVTKEEFDRISAELREESPDHVVLLETPPADIQSMEQLLNVQEGTFPNFVCRFNKGADKCGKCGRHYSVLDMAKTGLQFHDEQFIKNTIFGKHGTYLWNGNVQLHNCFACGEKAVKTMGYHTMTYGCSNLQEGGGDGRGGDGDDGKGGANDGDKGPQ